MDDINVNAAENLAKLRDAKPLIHNITNYVVMNYTANALLSLGASPVMAHAPEEVEEMASISGALVVNIGTLSATWVDAMLLAGKTATDKKIPLVLDPVGAGATKFRTKTALNLIDETDITVIRGNASEIMALKISNTDTKGVDSVHEAEDAVSVAKDLAVEQRNKGKNTVVAVTGKIDVVTDGENIYRIKNGHEFMGRITGTGCTASAVVGAFSAVCPDPLEAAVSALAVMGVAGEIAAEKAVMPGSYTIEFLNALYAVTPKILSDRADVSLSSV